MGLGAAVGRARGDAGVGCLGLVDLSTVGEKVSQDCFVGVGTITCHVGVCEPIKGVGQVEILHST